MIMILYTVFKIDKLVARQHRKEGRSNIRCEDGLFLQWHIIIIACLSFVCIICLYQILVQCLITYHNIRFNKVSMLQKNLWVVFNCNTINLKQKYHPKILTTNISALRSTIYKESFTTFDFKTAHIWGNLTFGDDDTKSLLKYSFSNTSPSKFRRQFNNVSSFVQFVLLARDCVAARTWSSRRSAAQSVAESPLYQDKWWK